MDFSVGQIVVEVGFTILLIVLGVKNARHFIYQDVIVFPAMAVSLALVCVGLDGGSIAPGLLELGLPQRLVRVADALAGLAICSGLLWLLATCYKRVRGREGIGWGDIKLVGLVGLHLGIVGSAIYMPSAIVWGIVVSVVAALARFRGEGFPSSPIWVPPAILIGWLLLTKAW